LKPVVCRRVVGRLTQLLALSFQLLAGNREPKAESPSTPSKRSDGLSCEIARIRTRDFHLTTGTFNLVVKDRIAFRLSGAPSVQAISKETDCPRNLLKKTCPSY